MEHVWQKIEELRAEYEILRVERTPIDVFTFFEVDLRLDPIPFPRLTLKYRVEAAITADFTGLYLDEEQYALMEKGPEWRLSRLRFTIAHELAHFFLHKDLPQAEHFSSLPAFAHWTNNYAGRKYTIEQEANEFAGPAEKLVPNFMEAGAMRDKFSEKVAPRFGVNTQVIAVRLDRDGIWPAG